MSAQDEAARTVVVLVVDVDGRTRRESWTSDGDFVDRLRGELKGTVTSVDVIEGALEMWVHDDSLYLCPPNPFTTVICADVGGKRQPYYGRAIFTGVVHGGAVGSLTDEVAAGLEASVKHLTRRPAALVALRALGELFQDAHGGRDDHREH